MQITYDTEGYNSISICFREWLFDENKYPRKYYWNTAGNPVRVEECGVVPQECFFKIKGDPATNVVAEFERAIIELAEVIKERNPNVRPTIKEARPITQDDLNCFLNMLNERER